MTGPPSEHRPDARRRAASLGSNHSGAPGGRRRFARFQPGQDIVDFPKATLPATPADGSYWPGNARTRLMAEVTYYVALPFAFSDDGVAAGEATECFSANAAVMRAEALSRKPGHAGAVAFSRSGEPATGDFGDAKLIRKFGDCRTI